MLGEDLITASEAAKLLRYTVQHVRLLARTSRIEAIKVGRDWLIVRQAVLDAQQRRATAPLIPKRRLGRRPRS